MNIIQAQGLHKRYQLGKNNFVHALRGATMEVQEGEMLAIMGPSGSGKSTVMHLMGCLDRPDQGEIMLGGRRVDNLGHGELNRIRGKEVGFVFQGFNLIPTMTALENVALAAEYAGASRGQARSNAESLLAAVNLSDRLKHKPGELSGGQQQRVAIARALVNKPGVVLGDEPTGDLDTESSGEIIELLRQINQDQGTTFVLVTHNPDVGKACDRIIHMRDGTVCDS
ncbi:MAG: ABC transporter ATP-binding protein [Thermoleophilia bacterium]